MDPVGCGEARSYAAQFVGLENTGVKVIWERQLQIR
jgi:hypothetical protein